jgi:hypothetical protein
MQPELQKESPMEIREGRREESQKRKLPQYTRDRRITTEHVTNIACKVCIGRSGFINNSEGKLVGCPCCNPKARETYGVSGLLEKHGGWTNTKAFNAIQRKEGKKFVERLVEISVAKLQEAKPSISNRQLKKFIADKTKELEAKCFASGKYMLKEEDRND